VDATNNSDDQEESIGCGTENRIDEVEKCWIIGLMISVWIEWSTATVLWLLVYYLVKWEIMLGALVFIHRYYFQLLMMYEFLHAFDKSNAWGISSRPQILFWTFCVVPIPTYTVTNPTEYKKMLQALFSSMPQALSCFGAFSRAPYIGIVQVRHHKIIFHLQNQSLRHWNCRQGRTIHV
jgi:hypothetical protein